MVIDYQVYGGPLALQKKSGYKVLVGTHMLALLILTVRTGFGMLQTSDRLPDLAQLANDEPLYHPDAVNVFVKRRDGAEDLVGLIGRRADHGGGGGRRVSDGNGGGGLRVNEGGGGGGRRVNSGDGGGGRRIDGGGGGRPLWTLRLTCLLVYRALEAGRPPPQAWTITPLGHSDASDAFPKNK